MAMMPRAVRLRFCLAAWLRVIQDNYYTMKGSMLKRTMVGGAENIELQVEIDCDLDDAALNEFLVNATYASPLNGLMRGQIESLFKLSKNGAELKTAKLDGEGRPDPEKGCERRHGNQRLLAQR